jgi:hypothetical protein
MKLKKLALMIFLMLLWTGLGCKEEKVHPGGIKCSDIPLGAGYLSVKKVLKGLNEKLKLEREYIHAAKSLTKKQVNEAERKVMRKTVKKLTKKIHNHEGWLRYCRMK